MRRNRRRRHRIAAPVHPRSWRGAQRPASQTPHQHRAVRCPSAALQDIFGRRTAVERLQSFLSAHRVHSGALRCMDQLELRAVVCRQPAESGRRQPLPAQYPVSVYGDSGGVQAAAQVNAHRSAREPGLLGLVEQFQELLGVGVIRCRRAAGTSSGRQCRTMHRWTPCRAPRRLDAGAVTRQCPAGTRRTA